MKKLEKFLISLSVIGVIFNLFSEGTGGVVVMLGMSLLGAFYLIFGFALFNEIGFRGIFSKGSYAHVNMRRIIIAAVFGITLFGLVNGIQFRLLGLEGAFEILVLSMVVAFTLFTILLVRYFYKRFTISGFFRNISLRLIPFAIISIVIIVEQIYYYYYG